MTQKEEAEEDALAGEQTKRVTGGPVGRYLAEHRADLIKERASMPGLLKETKYEKIALFRFLAKFLKMYGRQEDAQRQVFSSTLIGKRTCVW